MASPEGEAGVPITCHSARAPGATGVITREQDTPAVLDRTELYFVHEDSGGGVRFYYVAVDCRDYVCNHFRTI